MALQAFRSRASRSLERAIRSCYAPAFALASMSYEQGYLLPADAVRALGYRLASIWVEGGNPHQSLALPALGERLSAAQRQQATAFARQLYGRYCQ